MGGATSNEQIKEAYRVVSIAEAILWGEQHRRNAAPGAVVSVSIAEAILWGEQQAEN